MNYNDHPPPHFHVRYAEQKAIVTIDAPMVLEGSLSAAQANCASGVRAMLKDVVAVQPLPEHRFRVRFDDGVEGVIDT